MEKRNWTLLNQGRILSLRIRGIKESDLCSSSSQQVHRGRRGSFKENTISSLVWRSVESMFWQQGSKRFQYSVDDSGTNGSFRALQGHSGNSLTDLSVQDNVVMQSGFFQHLIVLDVRSSAFYFKVLISTWRSKFKQRTESNFPACWSYGQKSQWLCIAQHLQKAWRKLQNESLSGRHQACS